MKKLLRILFVAVALVIAGGVLFVGYVLYFLPGIPLEEVRIEYTHERIKRGEYLAKHVAGCVSCHSSRDWSRFSGPFAPGTEGKGGEEFDRESGFPGSFPATNITPFRLKDWSDAELVRAIAGGVSRDGRPLFPVMPYPYFGKMDREDIYSIIAYVRSLPSIENPTPQSETDFPMSIIIHAIPSRPEFAKRPSSKDRVAYGKYLANAAACIECHTPARRGQIQMEKAYSGGRFLEYPIGTNISSNITPDRETGIGKWTEEAFIRRFKAFDYSDGDKDDRVGKGGFNTSMPWQSYSGMRENDLAAIYAYLMTLKPVRNKVPKLKLIPKDK